MLPPSPEYCFALLDDCHASVDEPSSRLYTDFVREHRCADPDTLDACWQAVAGDMGWGCMRWC